MQNSQKCTDTWGPGRGGGPMLHVEFKKWQCRMYLSLIGPKSICPLSNLRNGNVECHY